MGKGGWGGLASKSFYSPSLRGKSDLGNGQTDGQETLGGRRERRENKEFSRSIIPTQGSVTTRAIEERRPPHRMDSFPESRPSEGQGNSDSKNLE